MAKIKGPLFSQSAAGPFAGAIGYTSIAGQHVARSIHGLKAAAQRNPPSAAQLAQRAIYAAGASAWQALTPAEREAWRPDAAALAITPYSAFMSEYLVTNASNPPDSPPVLADAAFTCPENAAFGYLVTTLSATDPDGDPIAYTITAGNVGGAFALDTDTGALSVITPAALDFEAYPAFTLTVTATANGASAAAQITVNLSDVLDTDPHWASVSLLVDFANSAADVKGHALTNVGGALIQAGALDLVGNGKYLKYDTSAALNFGSGNCTLEGFFSAPVNPSGSGTYIGLVGHHPDGVATGWGFFLPGDSVPGRPQCDMQVNGAWTPAALSASTAQTPGPTHHWAIQRNGSTLTLAIDGVEKASRAITGAIGYAGTHLTIGANAPNGEFGSSGRASKHYAVRITKGVARYALPFTPPTEFFAA